MVADTAIPAFVVGIIESQIFTGRTSPGDSLVFDQELLKLSANKRPRYHHPVFIKKKGAARSNDNEDLADHPVAGWVHPRICQKSWGKSRIYSHSLGVHLPKETVYYFMKLNLFNKFLIVMVALNHGGRIVKDSGHYW